MAYKWGTRFHSKHKQYKTQTPYSLRGDDVITVSRYLTTWMREFLRNKDLVFRRYQSIESSDTKITLTQKNGDITVFFVKPCPQDLVADLQKCKQEATTAFGLVLANTQKNLTMLLENWDKILGIHPKLCLYFINPYSNRAKQWALHPNTHQMITEGKALKLGLQTLFDTVDEITEDELTKTIKKEES